MTDIQLTPTQEAALTCNLGLVEPGKCDSCKAYGTRAKFYSRFTNQKVVYNLCLPCMSKAVRCEELYLRRQKAIGG